MEQSKPFVVRYRWAVLALAILGMGVAAAVGGDVASELRSGGFEDPGAESSQARAALVDVFDAETPDLVLVVSARAGTVDDPANAEAGQALVARLAQDRGVEEVGSYWQLGSPPPLRSTDGRRALVFARLAGGEEESLETAGRIGEAYRGEQGALDVEVGGPAATFDEVNRTIEEDLVRAELIAFPLTLLLLVVIFGSVVSASLPLGVGGLAILGTFLVLDVVAGFADVSIFALNFTTAIGLGLAIDYALLIVNRFREELAEGRTTSEAIRRTLRTAGRTVVFSAATVASALVALLAFEQYFLRSFAYAGIAVVALAAVGAVVVLPAILAILGPNVNRWRVRKVETRTDGTGIWHRIAVFVMRRPIPVATLAIAFLLVLGAPFLGIRLGFPDDRVLPPSAESRQAGELLRTEFDSREASSLSVVALGAGDPSTRADDIAAYATDLSSIGGVARVDALTGSYIGGRQVVPASPFSQRFVAADATYLSVVPSVEPYSAEGEELVADVRATASPLGEVLVGGQSAELVDGNAGILARLPIALAIIALVTFAVLFVSFGSVLMPIKAIVLNLLSLSATFGAMVWIFQEGNLAGVLDFTATGTLTVTMPVLMFVIAFGLSMDYEVFMLSRIREEFDRTGDNEASVALGLERTGRIVTAAALLIAVVFAAFSTGRVTFMKMFGIGMTLAVLVDAFVIRATLVPAFMRLAGAANWWAPAPLRRLHERIGFSETEPRDDDEDGDARGLDGPAGRGGDGDATRVPAAL